MNELMLTLNGTLCVAGWIYFKTNKETAREAVSEFMEVCEKDGINIDNIWFREAVLKDSHGEIISKMNGKEI